MPQILATTFFDSFNDFLGSQNQLFSENLLGKEALDILEISIETNTAKKSQHFGHLFCS